MLQMAQNLVQMAFVFNKNSFCLHLHVSPFCTKTNLRENRFFAPRWAIGGKKDSNNVKFLAESWTKAIAPRTRVWPTARKVSMASTASASDCRAVRVLKRQRKHS